MGIGDTTQRKEFTHDGLNKRRTASDALEGSRNLQKSRGSGRGQKVVRVTVRHETLNRVTEGVHNDTRRRQSARSDLRTELGVHLVLALGQRLHRNRHTVKPEREVIERPLVHARVGRVAQHEDERVDVSTHARKLNPLVGTAVNPLGRSDYRPLSRTAYIGWSSLRVIDRRHPKRLVN